MYQHLGSGLVKNQVSIEDSLAESDMMMKEALPLVVDTLLLGTSTCRVSISKQILANKDVIIKQNSELATKLDKLLNKTTCEVHVGGEHPSGAENNRFQYITNRTHCRTSHHT